MQPTWTDNQTELNSFEIFKLEKDGLDILANLEKYKETGFESIPVMERDLLKWAGVYLQRPRTDGYFMMRVKIPSGILSSTQARVIAKIAQSYGRDLLDLTTRQAIQFHWLTIENLPDVLKILHQVELDTIEACGDCPRTVIGNPLSGIDPNETMDTSGIVQEVFKYFQNNREFSNLPRKFKISISSNMNNAAHAEINDLAFTPAVKTIDNKEIYGFHVYVGGGLSSKPHLAKKLNLFVRPEEVLKVAIGVATIFRDFGYRKSRNHSRLKFLLMDWGAEKFESELLNITGPLDSAGTDLIRSWNAGFFYGLHEQKQPGLYYLGLSIPVGRLNSKDLLELADLADKHGNGSIRTCNSKNLVLANIPAEKVETLMQEELLRRFSPVPKPFVSHTVSCTGKEFCNLALVETKQRALKIAEYLDNTLQLDKPVRIHVNGCPNSCGQLQIADIGLRGVLGKIDGKTAEHFEISIGGMLGENAEFATPLRGRVPADRAHIALECMLAYYVENKTSEESFHDFVSRVGIEAYQQLFDDFLTKNVTK